DPNTGLVTWTPTADQAGAYIIVVAARDAEGNQAQQRYAMLVRVNQAPEIVSNPPLSVSAGATYRYDVQVDDPENDEVTFALLQAPAGMTIDSFGRIVWATAQADLGPHTIEILVTDSHGATTTQLFTLSVDP